MDKTILSGFGFEVIEGNPFDEQDKTPNGEDGGTTPPDGSSDGDDPKGDSQEQTQGEQPDPTGSKKEGSSTGSGNNDNDGGSDDKPSVFAQFAMLRQKNGILSPDLQIKKDLTESEFDDLMLGSYRQLVENEYKEKYGEDVLQIADDLNSGVTQQKILNAKTYENLASIDISGEDPVHIQNQTRIIQAAKYHEGVKDVEDLNAIVEDYKKKGILAEMAKQMQPGLKDISANILKEVRDRIKQDSDSDNDTAEKNKEKLVSAIRSKKYDGLEVNDDEAKSLEEWVYTKNQVIFGENGIKKRVTGLEKLQHEIKNDPEKQASFLYMMQNGFNVIKGKGEQSMMNTLSSFFEGKKEEVDDAGKKKPTGKETESALDKLLDQAEEIVLK